MASLPKVFTLDGKHSNDINFCAFSRNILITVSSDCSTRVWEINSDEVTEFFYSPLLLHSYSVNGVDFTAEGTLFATCSTDGTCGVHETENGERWHTFVQSSGVAIRCCKFSGDSKFLVTAGDDDNINVWDMAQRDLHRTLTGHVDTIYSLCFTPDSSYLVSSDIQGSLLVWHVPSKHTKIVLRRDVAHDMGVQTCDFASKPLIDEDGLKTTFLLATGGHDNLIRLWDFDVRINLSITQKLELSGHDESVYSVKFSPDGSILASASGDKSVRIWNSTTGALLAELINHQRYVTCCAFSQSEPWFASVGNDKRIQIYKWRRQGEQSERSIRRRHKGGVFDLKALNRGVKCIATASAAHKDEISGVSVHSKGFVISVGKDKMVKTWTPNSEWSELEPNSSAQLHGYPATSLTYDAEGEINVSASVDGNAHLLSEDLTVKTTFHHKSAIRCCALSGDGQILITGGDDHAVKLWELETGTFQRSYEEHEESVNFASFTSGGSLFATGDSDGILKVWSKNAKNALHSDYEAHDMGIISGDAGPREIDGYDLLVTGGIDGVIRSWKVTIDRLVPAKSIKSHGGSVLCLKFSHSGAIFASTSEDKTIRLWDSLSAGCLHILSGHLRAVSVCAFSRDDKILVSGSADRCLRVWRLQEDESSKAGYLVADWSSKEVKQWLAERNMEMSKQLDIDGKNLLKLSVADARTIWTLSLHDAIVFIEQIQRLRHNLVQLVPVVDDEDGTPMEYLCPITQEIMKVPVLCKDGFTYEEAAILEWVRTRRSTSPMTNMQMDEEWAVNEELKMAIAQYNLEKENA